MFNPFTAGRELKRSRERVASLEFAIREANDWLMAGEGVDLLYNWPKDTAPTFRALVESLIPDEYERS